MSIRTGLVLVCLAGPVSAQAPLSAIDWLSDTVVTPHIEQGPNTADAIRTEKIDVAPLDALAIDGVGLLPPSLSGLPRDFWGTTPTTDLVALIDAQPVTLPRPARALLHKILLAELNPPIDADPRHLLFLSRIDILLKFGALAQAQALLERAGPTKPGLFRRWFDVSLLTGSEDRACATMRAVPDIAPTFSARIFCLARGKDWAAAALSLETARALNTISRAEADLMARFLDPEIDPLKPMTPLPSPLTPLEFRMLQALGEAPPGTALPLAFAHARLGRGAGWKTRLESAERLARRGGIAPNQLFSIYTERRQAASGGVWERVEAVQAFDVAVLAGELDGLAQALPLVVRTLGPIGLLPEFAQIYGERLQVRALEDPVAELAQYLVALSPFAEAGAQSGTLTDPILVALSRGLPFDQATGDSQIDALGAGFDPALDGVIPRAFSQLLSEKRLGEATLRALSLIGSETPDANDLETGLRVLRKIGFEQDARDIALFFAVERLRALSK